MSPAGLGREMADASVGVVRLIRYDPRWPDRFDPTAGGFLRSFLAPIIGLAIAAAVTAFFSRLASPGEAVDPRSLWAAGVSQIIGLVAYPAVVAMLARPLGIGAGYGAFIVVVNWASLFLNVAMSVAGSLLLFKGMGFFGLVWMILFGGGLFVIWRAAREALSPEIPLALLMVVLWVGLGVLSNRLGAVVVGYPAVG